LLKYFKITKIILTDSNLEYCFFPWLKSFNWNLCAINRIKNYLFFIDFLKRRRKKGKEKKRKKRKEEDRKEKKERKRKKYNVKEKIEIKRKQDMKTKQNKT